MDFGRKAPESRFRLCAVGESHLLQKLDAGEVPGADFRFGDRRGKVAEDLQKSSLGLFREVAGPEIRHPHGIEAAGAVA